MFLIFLLLLNILFINSNNLKSTATPYNSFKSYDDSGFRYNFTKFNKSLFIYKKK